MFGPIDIFPLRHSLVTRWNQLWTDPMLQSEQLYSPAINRLFPGVKHLRLLFTTGEEVAKFGPTAPSLDTCIVLPAWRVLSPWVYPVLAELFETRLKIEDWEAKIRRVQLNWSVNASAAAIPTLQIISCLGLKTSNAVKDACRLGDPKASRFRKVCHHGAPTTRPAHGATLCPVPAAAG
eukprot:SAG31_NODE_10355_length_1149_cov_1.282857_2_plen_179_part_00